MAVEVVFVRHRFAPLLVLFLASLGPSPRVVADEAWEARLADQAGRLEAAVAEMDGEAPTEAPLAQRIHALDGRVRRLEAEAGLPVGPAMEAFQGDANEVLRAMTQALVLLEGRVRKVRDARARGDAAPSEPAPPDAAPAEDPPRPENADEPGRAAPDPRDASLEAAVDEVRPLLDALGAVLRAFASAPRDRGHDERLHDAWREHMRPRAPRMGRRIGDLASPRLWVLSRPGGLTMHLVPSRWGPFVRDAAALHTELGVVAEGYARVRVTPDRALAIWTRQHPGPRPIGRVPAEDALAEVQAAIRTLIYQGLPVPWRLRAAESQLLQDVAWQQEAAREQARLEYEAERAQATARIVADVQTTQAQLSESVDVLVATQAAVRKLIATAQRLEEDRLRLLSDAASLDDAARTSTDELLRQLAASRERLEAFAGDRLADYGMQVQQTWMVPRNRLLALLGGAPDEPDED